MDLMKALEIKKALFAISDLLEITPQELVNSICLLDKERHNKIQLASKVWNEFDDADFPERAKMLGFTVSNKKG